MYIYKYIIHNYRVFAKRFFFVRSSLASKSEHNNKNSTLSVNSDSDEYSGGNGPITGKSYYNIHLNRKETGNF